MQYLLLARFSEFGKIGFLETKDWWFGVVIDGIAFHCIAALNIEFIIEEVMKGYIVL